MMVPEIEESRVYFKVGYFVVVVASHCYITWLQKFHIRLFYTVYGEMTVITGAGKTGKFV